MLEMFTDANPLRTDDFALPADGARSRGKYKDDAERDAELAKKRKAKARAAANQTQ